jgi:NADH-quinone oxidoreductase subunit A
MAGDYTPILILMAISAVICAAMVTLSWVLGPKRLTNYKSSAYECGVAPVGDANHRFSIKFYVISILFVLFDIEVVFLWSILTVFKDAPLSYQLFVGAVGLIYFALWILGDAYALRKNAIDWDDETSIAPEKLASAYPVTADPTPLSQPVKVN